SKQALEVDKNTAALGDPAAAQKPVTAAKEDERPDEGNKQHELSAASLEEGSFEQASLMQTTRTSKMMKNRAAREVVVDEQQAEQPVARPENDAATPSEQPVAPRPETDAATPSPPQPQSDAAAPSPPQPQKTVVPDDAPLPAAEEPNQPPNAASAEISTPLPEDPPEVAAAALAPPDAEISTPLVPDKDAPESRAAADAAAPAEAPPPEAAAPEAHLPHPAIPEETAANQVVEPEVETGVEGSKIEQGEAIWTTIVGLEEQCQTSAKRSRLVLHRNWAAEVLALNVERMQRKVGLIQDALQNEFGIGEDATSTMVGKVNGEDVTLAELTEKVSNFAATRASQSQDLKNRADYSQQDDLKAFDSIVGPEGSASSAVEYEALIDSMVQSDNVCRQLLKDKI
ncbi:unnamed protein product, partial [Amoebophrya sp. A25]